MYIERILSNSILKASKQFPVVLLTGPRQVGKTTLLQNLADQEPSKIRTFITLDDPNIRQLAATDPALFFQRFQGPLLIDEIQYAPGLLPYIKMMVDQDRLENINGGKKIRGNGRFWLTGSQMFQVMRGISESLAGRIAVFHLQSLSNSEIEKTAFGPFSTEPEELMKRRGKASPLPVSKTFERIFRGGMPALAADQNMDAERFFSSYIQTYLRRDIRDLTQVANELQFYRFLQVAAAHTATMLVYEDIARESGITGPTAKQWISLLVSTGIVTLIQPWTSNALKRIIKSPRLYFLDTGLCAHLLKWGSSETLEAGPMSGPFFETWVVSEIYKSYLNAGIESPLYYYRDKEKKEIDLLLHANGTLSPVEIKKTASPDKTMIRNFAVLSPLNEAAENPATPWSPSVGNGALVCQISDLLPVDQKNMYVPVSYI